MIGQDFLSILRDLAASAAIVISAEQHGNMVFQFVYITAVNPLCLTLLDLGRSLQTLFCFGPIQLSFPITESAEHDLPKVALDLERGL